MLYFYIFSWSPGDAYIIDCSTHFSFSYFSFSYFSFRFNFQKSKIIAVFANKISLCNKNPFCKSSFKFSNQKQPREVFCKKVVLKNFATFKGKVSFLIKWQASSLQVYHERPWHRCFSVNFAKKILDHLF